MRVQVIRNLTTDKVDCVTICPETADEESLLTEMVDCEVNLVRGILFMNKEDRIKGKRVQHSHNEDIAELTMTEVYTHR